MAKIVLLTDTHFGARNDSAIFREYFFKFYNELFFPFLEDNNIKTVVHLGDIVDRRKYINFNTLKSFRDDFVFRLGRMGIDTHIIIGNHDCHYKNTNRINSMDTLFSTLDGKYEPWIYSSPTEVNIDGLNILMVPWINSEKYDESVDLIKTSAAPVLMGHLEIKGFLMDQKMRNPIGLNASLFDRFDMVMSGHFHHKSDNGTIFYLGNPYEMTWIDYNDKRGFHTFDTETRELEFIQNPYRMFHKIYYDDTDKTFEEVTIQEFEKYKNTNVKVVVQNKTNPYWFDIMLDGLYKVGPNDVKIVEDYSEVILEDEMGVDQAEDTMSILNTYIDSLNSNTDKTKLKSLFKELYQEANTLGTE